MVAIAEVQQRSELGLGASEIAAALNLNPYRSAYDVWAEKTGRAAPFAGNKATRWGQLVESAARAAYVEETGYSLHVPPESLFSSETLWARATPDAIAMLEPGVTPAIADRRSHLVQLKNTGYWPGQQWKYGPPEHVVLQEQWEMYVTGLHRADVVVSIGGGFPDIFTVHRDQRLIDSLVIAATKFWRYVVSNTPPPVDDTDACREHWTARAREAAVEGVIVPFSLAEGVAERYREAWLENQAANRILRQRKAEVLALCAQAEAQGVEATDGNIMLQTRAARDKTDWQGIARLIASAKGMSAPELEALVTQYSKPGKESVAVVAPRSWGREVAE